ncbi:MAG: hypothetical protein Q4Q00_00655 [Turicibacter sp.]|nr:hypothetical protein [Turicibacter sp.]
MKNFYKAGGLLAICFFFNSKMAFASSFSTDLARENVEVTTMFSDVFRWLIWWLVKLGYSVCGFFEQALNYIFDIAPNFSTLTSNEFINHSVVLGIAFLSPILVWIGLKAMTKQNHNLIKQTSMNLLVIASLITSLTLPIYNGKSLIPLLSDLTQSSMNAFLGDDHLNLSKSLILDQLVDLQYVINQNSNTQLNNIKENTFEPEYFNINELLDRDKINKEYPVYNQSTGEWESQKLKDGWFGWFDENIYRYQLQDPFVLILSFLVLSLGFIFAGLKFLRLILELSFKQILLPFVGLTDVENGQRFKKLLHSIGTTFLLMVVVVVIFRCYQLAIAWINTGFGLINIDWGIMMYMKLLGYIAAVLMLLDGPKIVEELFGMDAGISGDAVRATSHAMNIAKNTKELGQSATKGISNIAKTGKTISENKSVQKVASSIKNGVNKGVEKAVHFKGFDENGNVMSSNTHSSVNPTNDTPKSTVAKTTPTEIDSSQVTNANVNSQPIAESHSAHNVTPNNTAEKVNDTENQNKSLSEMWQQSNIRQTVQDIATEGQKTVHNTTQHVKEKANEKIKNPIVDGGRVAVNKVISSANEKFEEVEKIAKPVTDKINEKISKKQLKDQSIKVDPTPQLEYDKDNSYKTNHFEDLIKRSDERAKTTTLPPYEIWQIKDEEGEKGSEE